MSLTTDDVKKIAHLARLGIDESDIESYARDLSGMDSYGWLKFKQGDVKQALLYLQQAYDKRQEGEIAAHLAEVLWFMNRKVEARKIFTKAIKDAPKDESLLDFQKRILNAAE